jgi:hypothetical protein
MPRTQWSIVLTKHARERMTTRRISQRAIERTVQASDQQKQEDDGDTQFIKTVSARRVHVIAKPLPDEHKWLIKTVWVRGEADPHPIIRLLRQLRARLFNR